MICSFGFTPYQSTLFGSSELYQTGARARGRRRRSLGAWKLDRKQRCGENIGPLAFSVATCPAHQLVADFRRNEKYFKMRLSPLIPFTPAENGRKTHGPIQGIALAEQSCLQDAIPPQQRKVLEAGLLVFEEDGKDFDLNF